MDMHVVLSLSTCIIEGHPLPVLAINCDCIVPLVCCLSLFSLRLVCYSVTDEKVEWFQCCVHVHVYFMTTDDQEPQSPDQQQQSCAGSQAVKHPCTDSANSDQGPETDSQNMHGAGSQTSDQDHETDSQNVLQSCSHASDHELRTMSLDSEHGRHQDDPQSSKCEPQAFSTRDSTETAGPISSGTCTDEKEHSPASKDVSMKLPPDRSEPMADMAQKENGKLPTSLERDGEQHGLDPTNKPPVCQEMQVNTYLSECKY